MGEVKGGMNVASSKSKQKQPWYLRKGWVYAMCLITPPIGLINVFLYRNHWQRDEKIEYIGITMIMGSFWILKFSPFWMTIAFAITALLCFYANNLLEILKNKR